MSRAVYKIVDDLIGNGVLVTETMDEKGPQKKFIDIQSVLGFSVCTFYCIVYYGTKQSNNACYEKFSLEFPTQIACDVKLPDTEFEV